MTESAKLNEWRQIGFVEGRAGRTPILPTGRLEKIHPGIRAAYREGFAKGKKEWAIEGMKGPGRPVIFMD